MKDYYEHPTQVMFGVEEDDDINYLAGIAYHDYVICLDCGEILPLQAGQFDHGFRELAWVSLSEECLGDEPFFNPFTDEELGKNAQNDDSKNEIKIQAIFSCGRSSCCFFQNYPSSCSKEEINSDLIQQYIEWAKNVCRDFIPEAVLERFGDFIDRFGLTKEEFCWDYVSEE